MLLFTRCLLARFNLKWGQDDLIGTAAASEALLGNRGDDSDTFVFLAAVENVLYKPDDGNGFLVVVAVLPGAFDFQPDDRRQFKVLFRVRSDLQLVFVESRVRKIDQLRILTAVVIGKVYGVIPCGRQIQQTFDFQSRLSRQVERRVLSHVAEILFDKTCRRTQLL